MLAKLNRVKMYSFLSLSITVAMCGMHYFYEQNIASNTMRCRHVVSFHYTAMKINLYSCTKLAIGEEFQPEMLMGATTRKEGPLIFSSHFETPQNQKRKHNNNNTHHPHHLFIVVSYGSKQSF